jgi:hypothetical protein
MNKIPKENKKNRFNARMIQKKKLNFSKEKSDFDFTGVFRSTLSDSE